MRPRRLPAFSYVGCQRYFLTLCAFERRRHFVLADAIAAIHAEFLRTSADCWFEILAYCFMPDHVHLLVEGMSDRSDLTAFVPTAKQRAAHVARQSIHGRLWQAGYFERVLRDDDDTINVARYVVQNPVRAGLVRSPGEYLFLGSSILSKEDLIGSCVWTPRMRGGP